MSDAKASLRIAPLVIDTVFRVGDEASDGYVTNLSEGGAFLATDRSVPVGDNLQLRFFLPRERNCVEVEARVMWRTCDVGERAEHLPRGMGLAFEEISIDAKERLSNYMARFLELADLLDKVAG